MANKYDDFDMFADFEDEDENDIEFDFDDWSDIEDGFAANMPCDTTGLCSPRCPKYYTCKG